MTLTLRYMTLADVQQVVAIDEQSFDPAWSAHSYAYEISESRYSHMAVVEQSETIPINGWRRWMQRFVGSSTGVGLQRQIVGYGGLWRMMEEAHISTIATHPRWRGHSYGEILIAGMVRRSLLLNAAYVVLEVRVSNTVAQNLYRKYEFNTVSVKRNYYRSNNEDAYEMHLTLDDPAMLARFDQRMKALQTRVPFIDLYNSE